MVGLLHAVLLSLPWALVALNADKPSDLDYQMACDNNDNYWIYWKHDEVDLTVEFHVATAAWIGFGISPNGRMWESDIMMMGVTAAADPYLEVEN